MSNKRPTAYQLSVLRECARLVDRGFERDAAGRVHVTSDIPSRSINALETRGLITTSRHRHQYLVDRRGRFGVLCGSRPVVEVEIRVALTDLGRRRLEEGI